MISLVIACDLRVTKSQASQETKRKIVCEAKQGPSLTCTGTIGRRDRNEISRDGAARCLLAFVRDGVDTRVIVTKRGRGEDGRKYRQR